VSTQRLMMALVPIRSASIFQPRKSYKQDREKVARSIIPILYDNSFLVSTVKKKFQNRLTIHFWFQQ